MKKIVVALATVLLIAIIAIAAVFMWRDARYSNTQAVDLPPATSFNSLPQNPTVSAASALPTASQTSTPPSKIVPTAINLQAVFYAQAPGGNWDYPWQEACEEASILLIANEYFQSSMECRTI